MLSTNRIAQIVIFICALGGIFIYGKLPIWIALTALLLPFLIFDVLVNRPKINGVFFIFTVTLILVSMINYQTTHISTLSYSLFLCSVFLFSKRKIELCNDEHLINIYHSVILVFFILIILGLFLYYSTGISDFSLAKVDISRNHPRSFGPSTEPSYSALTLTIAVWVIGSSKYLSPINIRMLIIIYITSIALIGSGIGFLTCVLFIIYLFTLSNIKIYRIEKAIAVIVVLSLMPFLSFDVDRLKPIIEVLAVFLGNGSWWDLFDAIKYADSSAWFRFGPFIEYFRDMDMTQINGFFLGNGAGTSSAYFGDKYVEHLDPEWFDSDGKPIMDLPFFPAFLYDYGVVVSLILLSFIWSLMKNIKGFMLLIPLAFFILFNSNFNTSMFWFFIYSLLVINVLQKKGV